MERDQTSDVIAREDPRARRVLVVVALAAALASAALAIAMVPTARGEVHTAAHNRASGRAAAGRLLARAPLPAGATRVATDPEVVTSFTWLDSSEAPSGWNVVDRHRFVRVPMRPSAVFGWLSRHRPRGSTLATRGHSTVNGRIRAWSLSFAFPAVRDTITQEGVGFELTFAGGGGTALRVDGWAGWFVPRPAFERVPGSVHAVAVSVDGHGSQTFPVGMVTDPISVAKLVEFINSAQRVQPDDGIACGPSPAPRIDLRFLAAPGAAPVARAVDNACAAVNFSLHGRRGPALAIVPVELRDLVWQLHAVPACASAQLEGSATLPSRSALDPVLHMQLQLTNVAQTVCGLDGFPRLELRGADGQPLPTRPDTFGSADAAILVPHDLAQIDLSWPVARQCPQAVAASIDVSPAPFATPLAIAVGSPEHPVQPCQGRIYELPIDGPVGAGG